MCSGLMAMLLLPYKNWCLHNLNKPKPNACHFLVDKRSIENK